MKTPEQIANEYLDKHFGGWPPQTAGASGRGAMRGHQMTTPAPLDPAPWYVEEADLPPLSIGRYTLAEVSQSAGEGEWGGIIYNLAKWSPRPGYNQNREEYAE